MLILYMLECADDTLYVGHTDNLDERMHRHDCGKADAYTSSRRPLQLVFAQEFETRYDALAMERKLKGWSRAKKLAYVAGDWNRIRILSKGKHRHQRMELHASTSRPAAATLSANGPTKAS